MIDRIEYHVENAVEYTEQAKEETKQALVYANKSRKVWLNSWSEKNLKII